jgi:hypothetical protein
LFGHDRRGFQVAGLPQVACVERIAAEVQVDRLDHVAARREVPGLLGQGLPLSGDQREVAGVHGVAAVHHGLIRRRASSVTDSSEIAAYSTCRKT